MKTRSMIGIKTIIDESMEAIRAVHTSLGLHETEIIPEYFGLILKHPTLVGQYVATAMQQNALRARLAPDNPGLTHR
jgi:hypothetical protein